MGDYSDYDWDEVKSDIVDNIEVCEDPLEYARQGNYQKNIYDGDKTPTKEREEQLTVEELQIAAKKLNLCLVTPARDDDNVPTVPKRTQKRTSLERLQVM